MPTAKRVGWLDVREHLLDTFGGDEEAVRLDVEEGISTCWQINNIYMITRREGKTLIIVCIGGEGMREVAQMIIEAAKKSGCTDIRYHTARKGMGRILEKFGAELEECIYRIKLT
ncbi:MAG: hypothetical protein ACRBBR_00660 [Cellvibrionaceae bacterium]